MNGKMEKLNKIAWTAILAVLGSSSVFAQSEVEMADGMRADGKIYVVVAIILIVLVGLVSYLFVLDRKIGKLEKQLADKEGKAS